MESVVTQQDLKELELNSLLEITQAINNNLAEASLYKIYHFTLLGNLKVKKLALYVMEDEWDCKLSFGVGNKKIPKLPACYQNLPEEVELDSNEPFWSEFHMVFPVQHKEKLLAVVFLGKQDDAQTEQGVSHNLTFIKALTNIILVAIENKKLARRQLEQEAYRKELEIARQVQTFLFPKNLPQLEKLQIEATYIPHKNVGGDYYDYVELSNGKFLLCIADVSGKGVPAALLMSNFQAALRVIVRKTYDVREIVYELNRQIMFNSNGENFITFFMTIYDHEAGQMKYVNCGHNPPILFTESGFQALEEGTTILGIFEDLPFLNVGTVTGLKDFNFFCYTDGLTETFNAEGEEYGSERLMEALSDMTNKSLAGIHEAVIKSLEDFKGAESYRDDITMLSCKIIS
jgi:phosphoserine phosphatase RsbU/P